MYVVKPYTWETLWGDQKLYAYGADKTKEKVGILFTVSGIEGIDCEIENEFEKTTLKTATNVNPEKFGLLKGEEYPLIIAFDSCAQDVSFQLHPTDTYAKEVLGLPYGKSEAWYFIEPPTLGWAYAQSKSENIEDVKEAIKNNTVQDLLQHYPIEKDDILYIRSGTVHALTHGSFIYEIQQSTNLTYRLYDYNRIDVNGKKRPLHIKESLENLNPKGRVKKDNFSTGKTGEYREFTLLHKIVENEIYNESSIVMALSVVSGEIKVNNYSITPGKSILILPQERVKVEGKADCIIAIAHPYWRENV